MKTKKKEVAPMKKNTIKERPEIMLMGFDCSDETYDEFNGFFYSDEFLNLTEDEQIESVLEFANIAGSDKVHFNQRIFSLDFGGEWYEQNIKNKI